MAKTIGIVGWADGDIFGVNKKYLAFAEKYGNPRILLPTDDIILDLDLLILPGGPDIPYYEYSDIPDYNLSKQCPYRDHFEKEMLPQYIGEGIPVFGICRGFQALAAMVNISINPNISNNHPKTSRYARYERVHKLNLSKSLIINIKKSYPKITDKEIEEIKVNSLHHQGVVGLNKNGFICLGHIGGHCEVMYMPKENAAGVQYHPEELDNDVISDVLIKYLMGE